MSSGAKNLSAPRPDTAASSDVEGEESKPALPPKHILKRPIVATSRKNVITLMHQVMEEMGATGSLIQVESLTAATEALNSKPDSLLFVDWNLGADVAVPILKAGRGDDTLNLRPVLLLMPNVTSESVSTAMEYCVTKVFAGQLTAPSLKEQIEQIKKIQEIDRPISKQLHKLAEARKTNDREAVAELISSLHAQFPSDLRITVEYAECLIEAEQWVQAEVLLHPLWNREPPYLRALSAYSRCLLKKGSNGDAESVLKKAKLINPNDVDRLIELGDVLLMNGKVEEAQQNFSEAMQRDKSNKDAKFGKAKCRLLQDDVNNALHLIQEVASPRELASVFNTAAVMASRDKKFEHAIKLYETAARLVAEDPWLQARLAFNQGLAFFKWEKPEDALKQFEQAAKIDPSFKKAVRTAVVFGRDRGQTAPIESLEGHEESIGVDRRKNIDRTVAHTDQTAAMMDEIDSFGAAADTSDSFEDPDS